MTTPTQTHIWEDFVAKADGVDLVIANAGVGIKNAVQEGGSEEIAWLLQVNLIGVTNTVVPFIPAMLEQGDGVLVAVGSACVLLSSRDATNSERGLCCLLFVWLLCHEHKSSMARSISLSPPRPRR